jgi:hypothetical protein
VVDDAALPRMRPRVAIATLLLVVASSVAVRSQLWTVARPGERPRPLALIAAEARRPVTLGMALPAVPIGSRRLEAGQGVLLLHYWAPWEQGSRAQAAGLDSLRRLPALQGLTAVVVCFDPFPSVTRFVTRQRLRLSVLIDGRGDLRAALPCPSLPYTYVVDRAGNVAVAQPGDVDWWAPGTLATLTALLAEPMSTRGHPPEHTGL